MIDAWRNYWIYKIIGWIRRKNKEKIRAKARAYNNRPDVKKRRKAQRQTPIEKKKRKRYLREYNKNKTTIVINQSTRRELIKLKRDEETYSNLLRRLLK